MHSAWGFDIPGPRDDNAEYDPATGAGSRAVEFVAPAISSPAIGSFAKRIEWLRGIEDRLPHLRYKNLDDHGFVILDLTRERARAEFIFTDPIDQRSRRAIPGPVLETLAGANHLDHVAVATRDA